MRAQADMLAPDVELGRLLHTWLVQQAAALVTSQEPTDDVPDTTDSADDVQLLRRIGDGDASAYRVMVERYLQRVASFAQRLLGSASEAEDVAQDTFLKLWTQAPKLEAHGKPSTWLFRVAHHACIDRLRARRPGDDAQLERRSAGDRPADLLARKQTAERVQAALGELPERQRAAIALVHYDGFSNIEAAAVLDVQVDALESLLARGRRALREKLSDVRAEDTE